MKVTPIANPTGQPGQQLGSVELGRTANPMKLERARAIARGEKMPELAPEEVQANQEKQNIRAIKMVTQRSHNLPVEQEATAPEMVADAPEQPAQVEEPQQDDALSIIPETNEQETAEVTQPLSPQLAALAKQKRAFQLERAEFEKQKKEFEAQRQGKNSSEELLSRLKQSPLSVLQENGVTYDQLTEAILSGNDSFNPELHALKAEIKALKEGFDKTLSERDTQARQSALKEMSREAERLARDGDNFEIVRETGSIPKVIELIEKTYDETGEILDVSEAMNLVEEDLLKQNLRLAQLKKIQGKLTPQQQAAVPAQKPQMRTLTSRDSASPLADRKARAIAAFNGQLKRN